MRRGVTLVLLLAGMRLVLPLGEQGQGSEALLAFGFLILAAYTVGEMGAAARLPKVLGYLLAGIVFGPHVVGLVSEVGIERLAPVGELAVALIAFLAGAELQWAQMRADGRVLSKIMIAEVSIAFVAITALIAAMAGLMPPMRDASAVEVVVTGMVFASVAVVHSPAITMALLSETGARGPVARSTLGVVLLADVAVVVLFSLTLGLFGAVGAPGEGAVEVSLALVVWEIAGALVVGAAVGAGVALYLRFVGRELVLFAVLVALFGMEMARLAHVELLLTLLTAGFVAENATPYGDRLRDAMERSAAPIFVVFFALAGAKIQVSEVAPLLPLVIPIALVRAGAIRVGVQVGARWAGVAPAEPRHLWKGLISQAGVAIGLAAILGEAYPERGAYLAGLLLALVAVNESVGPILFRRALVQSGDAPSGESTLRSPSTGEIVAAP